MSIIKNTTSFSPISMVVRWVTPILFLGYVYGYLYWLINPALIYQCQVPPFLSSSTFFKTFLTFPGGPLDYLSHLFSQFYYYPALGAGILTVCCGLTLWLSFALIKQLAPGWQYSLATYIPSLLVLMLFSHYEHRLTYTLAWLTSQLFILLYMKSHRLSATIRFLFFLGLMLILYYIGAGFFLLFSAMAILHEWLVLKRSALAFIYLLVTLALPILAQSLFVLTGKSAFFYVLVPIYEYRPALAPYLLYIYFPLLLLCARFGICDWLNTFRTWRYRRWAAGTFLLLSTVLIPIISFDSSMHRTLKVDALARAGKWHELLAFVRKHPSDDLLVAFQTNRALFHVGRLSTEMFAYQQEWGWSGLFLPEAARKFFSIQVSDLYLDMGFVNEAEHWAQEDHSNFFYSPWHLQRMAVTALLKGNIALASMCVQALEQSILYRAWAIEFKKFIEHPRLVDQDSRFVYLKSLNAKQDFIVTPAYPERDMVTLLLQNQKNRAAFEFLMADYLVTFRLGEFIEHLFTMPDVMTSVLPRHYQEAVLVYLQTTQWRELDTLKKNIEPNTIAQFNNFMSILQLHHNDANSAQTELRQKYGDTYWYYSLYNNPSMRKQAS